MYLVIGYGFVGEAIERMLSNRGDAVRVFDIAPMPMDAHIDYVRADIRDQDALQQAMRGVHTVIHTASVVTQQLGRVPMLYEVNVDGTKNVIAAAQAAGVQRLIYTSSIDVVFDGTPIANGDEQLPYPKTHLDPYGTTKMLGEQAVLAANGQGGLSTCALRTAGIYGPNDRHRFPPVLTRAKNGQFMTIGDGQSKFSHVYVENVAHAHLLAADTLTAPDVPHAGRAYFITDQAPKNFFAFFTPYFDALGLDVGNVPSLSYTTAWRMASTMEWFYQLPVLRNKTPMLTRYIVASTSRDFWFNHDAATRDFGYMPIVDEATAFEETVRWFKGWLAVR